jgi:hypothetical protein
MRAGTVGALTILAACGSASAFSGGPSLGPASAGPGLRGSVGRSPGRRGVLRLKAQQTSALLDISTLGQSAQKLRRKCS